MSDGARRAALVGGSLLVSLYSSRYAIDLSVYHASAYSLWFLDFPLYGEESGLPWPMWYRYPPLFLFLFSPFRLLGFRASAFCWALLKCGVLVLLVQALLRRLPAFTSFRQWALAICLAGPYVLMEFRYGNAQFFVLALTAAGLLSLPAGAWRAGWFLGLAAALKVWPLFFLPLLAARRRWRAVVGASLVALGLTLLPALYFGWGGNLEALGLWYQQESAIAADGGRIWFPSQSVYGVLSRWLTAMDYSRLPDSAYPAVNVLELSAGVVREIWLGVAVLGFLGLVVVGVRTPDELRLVFFGLAFCALPLLQPYTQKQSALVVLIWPALVAGAYFSAELPWWGRAALLAAAGLSALQPMVAVSRAQRWFQVLGVDALVVGLMAVGILAVFWRQGVSPGQGAEPGSSG